MRVVTGRVARCRQRPDGSAAPLEAAPGDDDASEPPPPSAAPPEAAPGDDDASEPPPPSAAPPLGGPPLLDPVDGPPLLGPVEGDPTGVCGIGCAPDDAQDGQEEVGADAEPEGAEDESDGGVAAGPPDADALALAGALVALTGGPAAVAGAEALENAPTLVTSADRRDTRRLAPCRAARSAGELAEPTGARLCVAVRLDAAGLLERVLDEFAAPMISARTNSTSASATRRRRRMVARPARDGRLRAWRGEVGEGIMPRDSGIAASRPRIGSAANMWLDARCRHRLRPPTCIGARPTAVRSVSGDEVAMRRVVEEEVLIAARGSRVRRHAGIASGIHQPRERDRLRGEWARGEQCCFYVKDDSVFAGFWGRREPAEFAGSGGVASVAEGSPRAAEGLRTRRLAVVVL